ncbi:MAG TPA: DUF2007 domain-containing protein [Rubricoccaceae bacterium]|jgi:hypothetical protein
MTEQLVTIATFGPPFEAEIARGHLESEGIEAVVADGDLVMANWMYSAAIGGVKVLVPESDAGRARSILEEEPASDDEYDGPTVAESLSRRALTSSVMGLGFPPLYLYALYLIARYVTVADHEAPKTRRQIGWAVVFMVPWALLAYVLFLDVG